MIACKTTIGYNPRAPTRAGTAKAHGEALGAEELKGRQGTKTRHLSGAVFGCPDDVLNAWRDVGSRGAAARKEWESRMSTLIQTASATSSTAGCVHRAAVPRWPKPQEAHKKSLLGRRRRISRPATSYRACDRRDGRSAMPELICLGSADLTGSTNNRGGNLARLDFKPGLARGATSGTGSASTVWRHPERNRGARDLPPSGATFLVFADYCPPRSGWRR